MFLETMLCTDGEVRHLPYHQLRLNKTLQTFGSSVTYNLKNLITPPPQGIYRCRFLYDVSCFKVEYLSYTQKPVSTLRVIIDNEIDYPLKRSDRSKLDHLYTLRQGCDDILIVRNGYITDTTIANIALYDGIRWLTPETPLLEGTTRARLIEEGFLSPAPLRLEEIRYAQKIGVMNALIGFVEVENGIIM